MRPATDAPGSFLRLGALTVISTLISSKSYFRFGSQILRPNLFALIVAASSVLRKSEPIRWNRHAIGSVDPTLRLPTAGSVEGLIEALKERPTGTMLFDEFSRLLARARRDFAQDLPQFLCELYDGSPVRERRREGGIHAVEEPIVSLFGATAPEPLHKFLGSQDVNSGLLPRILLRAAASSEVSRLAFPPSMDMGRRDAHFAHLKGVYDHLQCGEPREFKFSDEGLAGYLKLDERLHREYVGENLAPFLERHGPMALKLACIHAFGRRLSFVVEAVDIQDAEPYVTDSLSSARGLLERIDENEAADFVVADANRLRRVLKSLWPNYHTSAIPHREALSRSNLSARRFWDAALHLTETGFLVPALAERSCRWSIRPILPEDIQSASDREDQIRMCTNTLRHYISELRTGRRRGEPQ